MPRSTFALHRGAAALLALAAGFFLSAPASGQATGSIAGTVTEAPALPLSGARVTVVGVPRAAITDERGQYRLDGLAAGSYQVTATALGHEPASRTVRVTAAATTNADFALRRGSVLLSQMVVSATRTARPASEVAATVNVLSPEQVRSAPARTTDDLLREMPGLELPRTSSTVSGPEEIVSIRGADEGRTLVLLDGVPLNDPWGEWIQWNRAPRFQLDHVEVLEGGGSSLYGNYAMGGVVSITSRPIVQRGYEVTASGGSRGAADVSLYGSGVNRALGYSLGADYGTGGGYTVLRPDQRGPVDQESETTRRNVTGRAEYALGSGSTVFASANYFDDDRSLGTPLTEPNRRRIASGALGGNFGSLLGGNLQLRAYGQHQRYDSRSSIVNQTRTSESPNVAQYIPSHDLGGSLQWSRAAGVFESIAAGADYRYMVGEMDETVYTAGGATRSAGGRQQVGGVFVQGVLAPSDPLRIEASARVDGWKSYDGSSTTTSGAATHYDAKANSAFAPRLGVRYAILPELAIRGSYYQAFRAPTLSEEYRTFYAGPNTFMGNPALTPEHLTGWDAGLDWEPAAAVELRATVFGNRYRDLDDFTFLQPGPTPGSAVLQRQNVGRARANGVEGEVGVRVLPSLMLSASYNYDDARVVSTGKPVNRVPLQRGSARVTWTAPSIATVNVIYRYEGPNHALGGARMAPYALVDLDARREIRRDLDVFVGAENLLDRQYTANWAGPLEYLGLPRTLRAGLSIGSF